MSDTRKILFVLLRAGLGTITDGDRDFVRSLGSGIDWRKVYKAAAAQGVLAVAWDGLQSLGDDICRPERQLTLQWAYNVQVIEDKYARQKRALGHLARFYAADGIRLFLLKGYGLSLGYPIPEHRPCGDIDIWLFGEQKRADALMRQSGTEVNEERHHHTVFMFEGVMVENHFDFLNIHSHLSNRRIEAELQRLAREERTRPTDVDGATVYLPSANFAALHLLRHTASHFAAVDVGLRHLLDWATFAAQCGSDVDWQWLDDYARRENMHRFLHVLCALSTEIFGLGGGQIPAFGRDEELETRVLNEIMSPQFPRDTLPKRLLPRTLYKIRRWRANNWKHRIVYRDNLFASFFVQIYSHLLKPKSI